MITHCLKNGWRRSTLLGNTIGCWLPRNKKLSSCYLVLSMLFIAEYRELSQSSDSAIWQNSNCEEIGCLAQRYGTIKGTNTIHFIRCSAIPRSHKAAYVRVESAFGPEKANPRHVRWTVGGIKVHYPFKVSTKTADLTTAKLLFNSVLSTPEALFSASI